MQAASRAANANLNLDMSLFKDPCGRDHDIRNFTMWCDTVYRPMPRPRKDLPVLAQVAHYLSLATILPACVFVGWLIGYGLDKWLNTRFLQIVFLVIGVVAGFVNLIRDLLRDTQE